MVSTETISNGVLPAVPTGRLARWDHPDFTAIQTERMWRAELAAKGVWEVYDPKPIESPYMVGLELI